MIYNIQQKSNQLSTMDMSYDNEWMRSRLYVPLGSGAIAATSTYMLIGSSGKQAFGMHPAVVFGGAVAIASNVSDMTKDYVLDNINQSEAASELQTAIMGPSLTGLAAVGVSTLLLGVPDMRGAIVMFGVGAGSEVAPLNICRTVFLPLRLRCKMLIKKTT